MKIRPRAMVMSVMFLGCIADPPNEAWIKVVPAPAQLDRESIGVRTEDIQAITLLTARVAASNQLMETSEWRDTTILRQWRSSPTDGLMPYYLVLRRHGPGDTLEVEIIHSWHRFPRMPTRALYRALVDSLRHQIGDHRLQLSDSGAA
jgi:hypothetical protein